jgi:hypothetical protein
MDNLKKCSKCQLELSLENFSWADRKTGRKKPYCKDCDKKRAKDLYKFLKDFKIESSLEWRRNNYPKYLEYQKYYNKNRRILPNEKD